MAPLEQQEVRDYKLINIAAFGIVDVNSGRGTYFSFSRIPGPLTARHGQLLEVVVPYIHQALMRTGDEKIRHVGFNNRLSLLTPKEKEVLTLIATGMSNKDIAATMSRSELTIQTHVHSLLMKLNVTSRAGAIALLR